ncbi:UHRF1-binding protein [Salix suchowensis]|nr:UHRF1-binding protein [Salix suchowensis]
MEAILARALEYTLKYWLKSFSRDQFKLQGRTVQLSNLEINGDALHASMGLPPALNVTKAKVGKFEIILPYFSNAQVEPIVIQIDKLDLVLEENSELDASSGPNSTHSSSSSSKGSGYGFADKLADGMTIQVTTVNLLLETRGVLNVEEGLLGKASPLASITIRNLLLYTTNENWQVVNLKEARDFSNNKKFIYVFKKLEWESLSIDLLPHPDMFADASLACAQEGAPQRDDDGAKRVFFGGERFLEGISGEAYITMQRTELNSPLGLEVQLHIPETICPALSEPGLRAFLRFMTGLYVCLNRGDVDLQAQQRSKEAAGRSLVSIVVDHIFLCIKDSEFQLELLMQSLLFSRATVSDGSIANNLTKVLLGGMFLRDTFSRPPCILVQPSMQAITENDGRIPDFAKNFCPPIYPLGDHQWQKNAGTPLICLHSLQLKPSPVPPSFASQTVIICQPLMIHLQEESCLRITSFLADGIAVNPGDILPDFSVNSVAFVLKELDVIIPLDVSQLHNPADNRNWTVHNAFAGARLHIENLFFSESPKLKLRLLNLEKDAACFCLWDGQPIDASQKKWTTGASHLTLSLETSSSLNGMLNSNGMTSGSWRCVELQNASVEVAMISADGNPLTNVPPPGGIVRVGVACQQYFSNTSVEQLFFVLDLYAYLGRVSEKIASVGKDRRQKINRNESSGVRLMDKVPCDTAVSLAVKELRLRFLESSASDIEGMPLVQFIGEDLYIKVAHRTLGGAIAISSSIYWQSVEVDCVETEGSLAYENGTQTGFVENGCLVAANGYPQLRAVFWVHNGHKYQANGITRTIPFLDISMVHVIPLSELDRECHSLSVSACISGVRLGGGMNYAEALLHRFGVLGPDGGPSEGLSKGLENLSTGPLSKLFKGSPLIDNLKEDASPVDGKDGVLLLEIPDDVDVCIEFKDWLFALEGAQEMADRWWFYNHEDEGREERCWHTSFQSLLVKAKSGPKNEQNGKGKPNGKQKYPVELVTVGVEGLQTLKPQGQKGVSMLANGMKEVVETSEGINLEVSIVASEENIDDEMANWAVENLKFSVKQPIEAVVTKDELQHLALLCKSEVDAMGRIAAGVLKLLKLEGSIGQAAIDQLSNLGSEGFDKIFTPDKLSKGTSPASTSFSPSPHASFSPSPRVINESPRTTVESTVASLEEAVLDSQAKLAALFTDLSTSESSTQHLADIKQLGRKLASMQSLVRQLRTKI